MTQQPLELGPPSAPHEGGPGVGGSPGFSVEAPPAKKSRFGPALLGLGAFILAKAKLALGALKFLKLGKVALTMVSMAAMIWFEAARNGLAFGVGFVLLILVHEIGHGVEIRRAGVPASWPVFIPFFGAMIAMRGRPETPSQGARIAFAGPVYGTLASLALVPVYYATHARVFLALAHTGFFLNLFNLTPIVPLDGGRVAQIFSRKAGLVGAAILLGLFFVTHAPQLMLIGLLVFFSWKKLPPPEGVDGRTRLEWALRYFGLCAVLGAATWCSGALLDPAS